jgi:hypothetical protein
LTKLAATIRRPPRRDDAYLRRRPLSIPAGSLQLARRRDQIDRAAALKQIDARRLGEIISRA